MKLQVKELSRNEISTLILGALGETFPRITLNGSIDVNADDISDALLSNNGVVELTYIDSKNESRCSKVITLSDIMKGFNKAIKANSYNLSFFMDGEVTSDTCESIMQYIVYGKIVF